MLLRSDFFYDTPSVTSVRTGDSSLKEGAEAALLVGHSNNNLNRRKDTGPSKRGPTTTALRAQWPPGPPGQTTIYLPRAAGKPVASKALFVIY